MLLLLDILIYSLLDPLYILGSDPPTATLVLASKIEFLLQEVLFFRKGGETMFVMTNPLILVHLLLSSLPFKLVRQRAGGARGWRGVLCASAPKRGGIF